MKNYSDELIIKCAKLNGWKPALFGKISVHRAVTAPFVGNKDLGEWWIYQEGVTLVRRVTDEDMLVFMRDRNIKKLI